MGAEASGTALAPPTPVGWRTWPPLAPVNGLFLMALFVGLSPLQPQDEKHPMVSSPGPHHAMRIAGIHLPWMAHSEWTCTSCKDHPLEVYWCRKPRPPRPYPVSLPEKQLLQEQPWRLGGLFRKLAQALSGILPTLLPTLPGTHPSRSLPVLRPMRQPWAGTALEVRVRNRSPIRNQAHQIPGSTRHP